jgi:NADPH:quinone reductase-like Zn-dependent oxidoreductase
MQAWTFTHGGFPKALHRIDMPIDAEPLKSNEIRVRAKAASINPVDAQLMGFPLWPYIPNFVVPANKGVGEDFAGIVEEAGAASSFKQGQEVLGICPFVPGGVLQEVLRLNTTTSVVVPKPADWSWEQAAALPLVWITARTAIAAVERFVASHAKDGKDGKLVVLGGSSSSGMYAVHIAAQRGWSVLATCSARNSDFVSTMGASETVDYTQAGYAARIKAFAPDAIIDCVGGTDCLGMAQRYVTIVGDKTSRMTMGGRNTYLWNPQMVLRAILGRVGLGRSYTCLNLEFKKEYLEEMLSLPKDKIIIDSTYDFGLLKEAFEKLITGRVRGKVIVRINPQ